MQIGFYVLMFILGAIMGSFLCCQARRLHRKSKKKKPLGKRSACPHCRKQLKWYENIPIFSWLVQRGKCNYCKKPIGAAEILSELGVATAFLMLATTIDISTASIISWLTFVATLLFTATLLFLAIYDGLYGELPNPILVIAVFLGLAVLLTKSWGNFSILTLRDAAMSVSFLGGVYLLLYLISKGKWVGDGDWILGVAIGLALLSPWLSIVVLFLSNLIACIVMLPFVLKSKNTKIYFGPFLVIAFILAVTFSGLLGSMVIL